MCSPRFSPFPRCDCASRPRRAGKWVGSGVRFEAEAGARVMGIQYVTVKVDTSGLYQPLSSAVGVVGIVGPAPSAGAGFSNPTLFTRSLVGAPSEPYARVVPVLRVAPLASDVQTL